MVTNWRDLAVIKDGAVHLDESLLDPFDVSQTDYSGYNPARKIPPYESVIKGVLDLETTGLDPKIDRIIMIGLEVYTDKESSEQVIIRADHFENYDERQMLIKLGQTLRAKGVQYICTYNGYKFDIPFLAERMRRNGIDSRITFETDFETVLRNTSVLGRPISFFNPKHPAYKFIDTMNLVYQDDFVTRKLTKHSLKAVPVQWGMRSASDRLELSYAEILECWENRANGGLDRLEEYLRDDLTDTRMLTDKLLPNYYYQFEVLPQFYDIQKICNWGNSTKWNHLLAACYNGHKPLPDEKLSFKGGYTQGHAGFFQYPCKIDVASMYPFIMLAYNIHSYKDPQAFKLRLLFYFRAQRFINKTLGKKGDATAKHKEGGQKIFINSSFGDFGTINKPYNDMIAGAATTAYGRAIIKLMLDAVKACGGMIIGVDTDGIIYASASPERNKEIHQEILKVLPSGLNTSDMIEFEFNERAVWVPEGEDREEEGTGLRKTYIIFHHDGELTKKGKFNSRDSSWLLKNFQAEYLLRYIQNGLETALKYYQDTKAQIMTRRFPVKKLAVTRLVKSNEKTMPLLGFPTGERHTWYYYRSGTKPKGKPIYKATRDQPYSIEYYIDQLEELFSELPANVK